MLINFINTSFTSDHFSPPLFQCPRPLPLSPLPPLWYVPTKDQFLSQGNIKVQNGGLTPHYEDLLITYKKKA